MLFHAGRHFYPSAAQEGIGNQLQGQVGSPVCRKSSSTCAVMALAPSVRLAAIGVAQFSGKERSAALSAQVSGTIRVKIESAGLHGLLEGGTCA